MDNHFLRDVNLIMMDHEKKQSEMTPEYNIFKVLGISEREIIVNRMLADLLNPRGTHNRGIKYLKSFLEEVLGERNLNEAILQKANVCKEYMITNDRRIDIVIQYPGRFIPIEVKINAEDQSNQCFDYYQFARNQDENARVVYLTTTGYMPSEDSLSSRNGKQILEERDVQCISFIEDILGWLEGVIQDETEPVKSIIEQFMDAIREFTGKPDEELSNAITEKVLACESNYRSALQVEANMNRIKARVMYEVLADIEAELDNLFAKPEYQCFSVAVKDKPQYYDYHECANEDFYRKASTYPGINYHFRNVAIKNYDFWFRVEIENNLYAGFCLFDPKEEEQVDNKNRGMLAKVQKVLNINEIMDGDWYLTWFYLPTGSADLHLNAEAIPNFKTLNEAAVSMSDDLKRKKFAKEVAELVDEKLHSLLKMDAK